MACVSTPAKHVTFDFLLANPGSGGELHSLSSTLYIKLSAADKRRRCQKQQQLSPLLQNQNRHATSARMRCSICGQSSTRISTARCPAQGVDMQTIYMILLRTKCCPFLERGSISGVQSGALTAFINTTLTCYYKYLKKRGPCSGDEMIRGRLAPYMLLLRAERHTILESMTFRYKYSSS